jgi:hypothetical protein
VAEPGSQRAPELRRLSDHDFTRTCRTTSSMSLSRATPSTSRSRCKSPTTPSAFWAIPRTGSPRKA